MDIKKYDSFIYKAISFLAMISIVSIFFIGLGCSKKIDITNPNNFSQIEGVFIHKVKKFIMVESPGNQKYWFKFGTKTTFMADEEIFTKIQYNFDTLANRMRELAFLNKGLRIILKDERDGNSEEFLFNSK